MKILIAEDDPTSQSMLEGVLKRWGYDAILVGDGRAALDALREEDSPKLAILDWVMPEIEGVEVCRQIRLIETPEPPYLILLTARGEKRDIVEGLKAGANDYISKPYDLNELQARIEVGRKIVELQAGLHAALENLRQQALTDALTLAPNRRAILNHLETEVARARRDGSTLWVSMLDIDHFKLVNDQYGHDIGDIVLKECAQRIQQNIRPYDKTGRLGGEEFLTIVVMPVGIDPSPVFDRIQAAMKQEIIANTHVIHITVSQGIAQWEETDSIDDLMRKADKAMYQAKSKGRDRIEFSPKKTAQEFTAEKPSEPEEREKLIN